MSEMVERVARAIALCEAKTAVGVDRNSQCADHRALARAAIEAIREPTEAMVKASTWWPHDAAGVKECWDAMIDEALK